MRVLIITGDQLRHAGFSSLLAASGADVSVISEASRKLPGMLPTVGDLSATQQAYFEEVKKAEFSTYKDHRAALDDRLLTKIPYGTLGDLYLSDPHIFDGFDAYVVFGSSIIKRELLEFLQSRQAFNVHAGISPYYTGTACNFWAVHDKNLDLLGVTVHRLTSQIDTGGIFFHSPIREWRSNVFEASMASLGACAKDLSEYLDRYPSAEVWRHHTCEGILLRCSKSAEFNDSAIERFYEVVDSSWNLASWNNIHEMCRWPLVSFQGRPL